LNRVAIQEAGPARGEKSAGASRRGELLHLAVVYCCLALINLAAKVKVTPAWFDGELERNHKRLLAFEYTNNEQSRLLQFYLPELLVRLLGLSVERAYLLQRWAFVWLALVLFHVYLRHWFGPGLTFGGVGLLAAVLPLTYIHDLQESAPFLMVSFLCGLWAVRAGRPWLFALALVVGALNNETTLALPAVFFFAHFRGWRPGALGAVGWRTLAVAAPAFLLTAGIRYVNRNQPHLGGGWHGPDNVGGILSNLGYPVLDYYRADYLRPLFLLGPLWIYAYLRWGQKPRFIRATLLMAPLFVAAHLITGIFSEARQMVPLAYVIIPAAFFRLFPGEVLGLEGDCG
jgi:hypothetical protein